MSKVRMGVIGCGEAGDFNANSISRNSRAELVGVCDLNHLRADTLAKKYGTRSFNKLSEMSDEVDMDSVIVATPPQYLKQPIIEAIDKGYDVLTEKHLALSLTDAKEIKKNAEENGVRVCVIRNALFQPIHQNLIKEVYRLEGVDSIYYFASVTEKKRQMERDVKWVSDLPGGILGENIPHPLYLVRTLMMEEPVSVEAEYDGTTLKATLKGNHVTGNIVASKGENYHPPMIIVFAKDVTVILDKSNWAFAKHYSGANTTGGKASNNVRVASDVLRNTVGNGLTYGLSRIYRKLGMERGYTVKPHYRQVDAFVRGYSSLDGYGFDIYEGVENVRFYEKIWVSAGEMK